MNIPESSVKNAVEDLLTVYQNQGKLMWFRMNSGKMLALNADGTKRMVRLHKTGTWDFLVLIPDCVDFLERETTLFRVLWIETKSSVGKLSKEQIAFRDEQIAFGAECLIVTDAEQVKRILEG